MLELNETSLETFTFGDGDIDKYYILINLRTNSDGVDLQRLASADPRYFDDILNKMGCLLMLTGVEIDELVSRGELDSKNLHTSLFNLAKKEGIIL